MEGNATIESNKSERRAELVLAGVLVFFLVTVSFPLTIKAMREGGGPWGFGIIGLHFLIPLNFYFLFAVSAWMKDRLWQRSFFILGHAVTIILGSVAFMIFSVLPKLLLIIPIALAVIGISDRKRFGFYLILMMSLAITANIVLLKWELDFGRSIPIVQLLHPAMDTDP